MNYTDEEVIKALECCGEIDRKYCDTCTYRTENDCIITLSRESLDLINRQKAEIDILVRKSEEKQ